MRALLDRPAQAGDNPLGMLMAAASAPGATDADREFAALAAFRSATPAPHPTARRPSMLKSMLAKLAAAKILTTGAVAAAATGGVALAAATGNLPGPFDASPATAPPSVSASPFATGTPGEDLPTTDAPGALPAGIPSDRPDATPSPSLVGLCKAYEAGAGANHGAALDSPSFHVLITAAAAADEGGDVASYCHDVLEAQSHMPSGAPDVEHGQPSDLPTPGEGVEHGQPSDLPSAGDEGSHHSDDNPGAQHRPSDVPMPSMSASADARASVSVEAP